jgi:hypothetical protein
VSISSSSHAKQFFFCDLATLGSGSIFQDAQKEGKAFCPCRSAINSFGHGGRLSCFVVSFCLGRRTLAAGIYASPSCACQESFWREFWAFSWFRLISYEFKSTSFQDSYFVFKVFFILKAMGFCGMIAKTVGINFQPFGVSIKPIGIFFHGEALSWDQSTRADSNSQAPFFPILTVKNILTVYLKSSAFEVIKEMRNFMLDNLYQQRSALQ